jgi:hypothetical protein
VLAAVGLICVAGAFAWIASGVTAPGALGLWGPLALAIGGMAILVATGVRRRPVAAA